MATQSRAWTLIEMLVVISVIAILTAISIPGLSRAKASARQTKCLANLRQHHIATGIYSASNADAFPFGWRLDRGRSTELQMEGARPREMSWFTDGKPNWGYVLSAFWFTPIYSTYGNNGLDTTLWCPNDPGRPDPSDGKFFGTVGYVATWTLYAKPEAFSAPAASMQNEALWSGARASSVQFPSLKMLYTENTAFHEAWYTDSSHVRPHPHAVTVVACDGSATSVHTDKTIAGIVPPSLDPNEESDPMAWSMLTTPAGLSGRDW